MLLGCRHTDHDGSLLPRLLGHCDCVVLGVWFRGRCMFGLGSGGMGRVVDFTCQPSDGKGSRARMTPGDYYALANPIYMDAMRKCTMIGRSLVRRSVYSTVLEKAGD